MRMWDQKWRPVFFSVLVGLLIWIEAHAGVVEKQRDEGIRVWLQLCAGQAILANSTVNLYVYIKINGYKEMTDEEL